MRCDNNNKLLDSTPCINCLATLLDLNIKRIVFSHKDNTFMSCNPKDLTINHISSGANYLKKLSNSNSNSNSSSSMHTKVGDKNGQQASDKLMYGIFISGSKGAFNILEPLLTEIVALPEDMEEIEPYIFFVDSSGAAAYMRTLLGAIESAQLEALREICRSLQKVGTVTTVELMAVFTVWITNKDHYCHVLEEICRVINEAPAGSCMEAIFDGLQNSEDVPLFLKHTLSYGQGLNCELPTVSATRDALHNNGRHAEFSSYRTASLSFQGPHIENWQLIEDCMNAFSAASTILYAQCFHLLRSASAMHEWHVPMGELLRLTAVMSRVRSQPLERVYAAYCNEESSSSLPSILFDSNIHTVLSFQLMGYRRVVTVLVAAGLPCPVLSSALTGYHDTLMYNR